MSSFQKGFASKDSVLSFFPEVPPQIYHLKRPFLLALLSENSSGLAL